jgi:hypothetical protein
MDVRNHHYKDSLKVFHFDERTVVNNLLYNFQDIIRNSNNFVECINQFYNLRILIL